MHNFVIQWELVFEAAHGAIKMNIILSTTNYQISTVTSQKAVNYGCVDNPDTDCK